MISIVVGIINSIVSNIRCIISISAITVSVELLLISVLVLSVDMNKSLDEEYKIWTHYSIEQLSR